MKINSDNLNINLRHLRALHAIAQEGSFSAAAAQLGLVPSALSGVIRQMEEAVGAPLFNRSSRPPVMTPLGRDFLADTAPLLDGMERAVTRLRQAAGLERGTLSVGASPSAISGLIAPVLSGFLARHPGIRCLVHDDIAERLAAMVSDGRLDLAIAGRAQHSPDLDQREILRDPVGLALAADHPLARADRISLDDIPEDQIIALDPDTGTQHLLTQSPQVPRAFLTPRLRAYSTIALLCMIRAGLGIALMPRDAVRLFADPTIAFRPVEGLAVERSLFLLTPARRPPSDVTRAFLDSLTRSLP